MRKNDHPFVALERRLAALEEAFASVVGRERPAVEPGETVVGSSDHAVDAGSDEAAQPAVDADMFWALEGLHARVPAPGAVMIVGDVVLPDGVTARWQEGVATKDLLDDEWDRAADTLAALGHPVRIRLIREVLRGTTTARELAELDGMGTSGQVYHHVRMLVGNGWLRARGGGHYEVPPERVVPLMTTVLGGRR